jgi:hypothetical protein
MIKREISIPRQSLDVSLCCHDQFDIIWSQEQHMNKKVFLLAGFCMLAHNLSAGPLSSQVKMHLGRPTIFINDQPEYPMIYALSDVPGGRWSWEELPQRNLQIFAKAGIRLFQVDLFLEHVWQEDGTFDLTMARKQLAGVLAVRPDAALFIRLHVNAPKWWMRLHPEENTLYADAHPKPDTEWGLLRIIEDDAATPTRTSLASKKWLAACGEKLAQFCRELADTPEGAAVAGLQLAGGIYGEWHYWGLLHNEPDLGEPMQSHFRAWLAGKYGNDQALQKAWRNPQVKLQTASVPSLNERLHTGHGVFRDPQQERPIIDYYQCQHQLVGDDIIYFCKIAKENWPRPLITGTFYGYYFSVFSRDATGGHLALQKVLSSPWVDYLSGPNVYYPNHTDVGDPYRSRSLIESVRLHGKLWLDEMDQQPYLKSKKDAEYQAGVQNSIAHVRRNALFTFSKGMGFWFYDFGVAGNRLNSTAAEFATGWWDHPALMHDIQRLKSWLDQSLQKPYSSGADVLMVFDTEVYYHVGIKEEIDPVNHQAVNWMTLAAFQAGAIFDPIHIADLERVNLKQYKLVVFANTFILSESQRRYIRRNVMNQGRHVAFVYAPGFGDERTLDADHISEVTNINVVETHLDRAPTVRVSDPDVTWTIGKKAFTPIFSIQDKAAQSWGVFPENNAVAVAGKTTDTATSWFFSLPPVDASVLRRLFQKSGVHLYADAGNIVYGGSGCLILHSKTGGTKSISLKNGRPIQLTFPEGACTVILDADNGGILYQ